MWVIPTYGSPTPQLISSAPKHCAQGARFGVNAWRPRWNVPSHGASGAARYSSEARSSVASVRGGVPARSPLRWSGPGSPRAGPGLVETFGAVTRRKRTGRGRQVLRRVPGSTAYQTTAVSGSAKPGISSSVSDLIGTWASSWQRIAATDAMTRIGIASLAGRSICRATLICATDRSN